LRDVIAHLLRDVTAATLNLVRVANYCIGAIGLSAHSTDTSLLTLTLALNLLTLAVDPNPNFFTPFAQRIRLYQREINVLQITSNCKDVSDFLIPMS